MSYVPPTVKYTDGKAQTLSLAFNGRAKVIKNVLCNGVRIGVIWKSSQGDFVVWYAFSIMDVAPAKMSYALEAKSLAQAMNLTTRAIKREARTMWSLLTYRGQSK